MHSSSLYQALFSPPTHKSLGTSATTSVTFRHAQYAMEVLSVMKFSAIKYYPDHSLTYW